MCDRCGKEDKLYKLPFVYKDMNDKIHTDLGDGYRQYYVCKKCLESQKRATGRR